MYPPLAYIDPSSIFTVTGGLTAALAGLLAGGAFLWGAFRRLGGFGRRHWGKIVGVICAAITIGVLVAFAMHRGKSMAPSAINCRVVLLGFDGLSPELIEPLLADGKLPNFQRLKERGCYARLATTNPSQSPVAWSTFATGRNPGKHGIFDFITRKPGSYLPDLSLASLDRGRSRSVRQTKAFWDYGAEAHVPMVILSCPVTFPPEPINGRMLAGMGVPDLLGTQGTFAFYTTEKEAVTNDTGGEVFVVEPADPLHLDLLGPYKAGLTGKAERMKLPFEVRSSSDRAVAVVSIQGQEFSLAVGEWSGWVNIEFRIGPFRRMRGLTRFHLTELQPHLKLYVSPISLDPREPWFPMALYLKGTCCSGKTSLTQLIATKWQNWAIVDDDAIVLQIWPEALASHYHNTYKILEKCIDRDNIYSALRFNQIVFKDNVPMQDQLEIKRLIQRIQAELNQPESVPWRQMINQKVREQCLKEIRSALAKGQNILIDSWYFSSEDIERLFPQLNMIRFTLYCSLPIAYQRLLKRNLEAIKKNEVTQMRNIAQLMITYCWLYELSDSTSQPIEAIDKKSLGASFQEIANALKETQEEDRSALFTFNELSIPEFEKMRNDFNKPFDGNGLNTVYITPKTQQNILIDNSHLTSQQSLELLEKSLYTHHKRATPALTKS
jgi:hypothetical protein